jgi:hypothetical protein
VVLRTTRFSPRSGLSHQPAFAKSLGNDLEGEIGHEYEQQKQCAGKRFKQPLAEQVAKRVTDR